MSRRSSLLVLVACAAVWLAAASAASACPSCQAALSDDASALNYARGVQYSILFMLSMPFAIIGAWAGAIYHMLRREKQRLGQQDIVAGHARLADSGDDHADGTEFGPYDGQLD